MSSHQDASAACCGEQLQIHDQVLAAAGCKLAEALIGA